MIPHTITPRSITLVVDSRHRQLDASHPNFTAVRDLLKATGGAPEPGPELDSLRELIDIPSFIAKVSAGRVQVNENEVRYDGQPIHGHIAERLLELLREGLPVLPLMRFLERLHKAPVAGAKDDFLRWLENSNLPITEDGCVIAYKYVRDDYTDGYSGTIDNKVDAVIPRLEPNVVNTNRNETCAASGYHFCSFGYNYTLTSYGVRCMLIRIAPEDIASFPYGEVKKGRCLWYEVIDEVPMDELQLRRPIEDSPLYSGAPEVASEEDDRNHDYGDDPYWCGEGGDPGDENDAAPADGAGYDNPPHVRDTIAAVEALEKLADGNASKPVRSETGREAWLARLKGIQHDGKRLTPKRLMKLVKRHGQREASRMTGIPRATLQGWLE